MTVGATLVASLLVTLARPATWLLALATFLIRGGFVLVLAPIVVLPTAVELGNLLAPVLTTLLFRGVTPLIALLQVAGLVAFLTWLVVGGLVAAAAESEVVRRVAADEEVGLPGGRSEAAPGAPAAHATRRVLVVRLAAYVPLLVLALPWSTYRFALVGYHELTSPSAGGLPLAIRIALGAPDAVALLLTTWLLGEVVGALAARRVVLAGDGVRRALGRAIGHLARRPVRNLALSVVPLVPLAVVLVIVGMAGSATWDALRAALSIGGDRAVALVLLMVLVALFAGGLVLIGVVSGWRSAVWTVDVAGTFGATVHDPEGQWNGVADSGTLTELRPRGVDPDTR
jgi:hypothetical protein